MSSYGTSISEQKFFGYSATDWQANRSWQNKIPAWHSV